MVREQRLSSEEIELVRLEVIGVVEDAVYVVVRPDRRTENAT